ncbi:MAG: glycosyltransferase family 4 protein [Candidatus Bathyarchaeia archaeon]
MLILTETLPPYGGGGALATYLYARLLRKAGLDITVIVRESNELIYSNYDFKVFKVNYKGYGKYLMPLNITLIKRLVKDSDVVHFAAASLNLIPFTKKMGKPVVAHIHSYYPACPIGPLYNFARNKVCNPTIKSCGRCIWDYERMRGGYAKALSSTVLNTLCGQYFLKNLGYADALVFVSHRQRLLFIENLDKRLNSNDKVIRNPLPDVDVVPMGGEDLGFFGGLDPIKGFSVLCRAWSCVFKKYPSSKLHTAMTARLSIPTKQLNIVSYGFLTGCAYENVYNRIRAVVVPSICPEPAPYIVIESCLRGKLLIASNIGGIPEYVEGLKGIRLVEPGNIDKLSDAIEWALSMSRKEAEELGLKNREGILTKFDNLKITTELIRVYEALVEESR